MDTKTLRAEMDKKRDEVIEQFKARKNRDITLTTGILPPHIHAICKGKIKFEKYDQILTIAEKLGL